MILSISKQSGDFCSAAVLYHTLLANDIAGN